jgi:mono/diheme cytochrome c family protein
MALRILVLLLAATLIPAGLAACGGDDDDEAGDTTAATATETEGGEGGTTGDAAAGEAVFASAGCGGCHVLEAAGSSGSVGPNLDDAQPSFDAVVEQVTNGGGAMPAFKDRLSEKEIQDVAAYVSESAGG